MDTPSLTDADLRDSHFALFGLPERFALDAAALDRAYRDLQTRVHPDRFAQASGAEQRVAMQWATRANEAYRVLRDPLRRAIYLCVRRGRDPADEANTTLPPDFLMRQLEWREALDDARTRGDASAVIGLQRELEDTRTDFAREVEAALDATRDDALACERVRQWMFVERFAEDVRAAARTVAAPAVSPATSAADTASVTPAADIASATPAADAAGAPSAAGTLSAVDAGRATPATDVAR